MAVLLPLLMLPTPVGGQDAREVEAVFWESVRCDVEAEVRLYLEEFPSGAYVAEPWR